jgi:class 3 adenylate cyclase
VRPAEAWLADVRAQERRGELLAAFDVATRGLEQHPHNLLLAHRAVLSLARAGATAQARARLAESGLDAQEDEDIASLKARIAKDTALACATPESRRAGAARAAELYGAVYERTGGYYPAINAATLWLLAGDEERSRELARRVLRLLADTGDPSYYATATAAEAQLLLGDSAAAQEAIAYAAQLHDGDYGALATTRRQLRLICEAKQIDPAVLAPLAGPAVAYFCGHIIGVPGEPARFPADAETSVAQRMAEVVARHPVGYAYGALAGGADIMWAETLLASGSELHVVLPFAQDEFVERSVAACGEGWVTRFQRCLGKAAEVRYATNDAFLGDDVLFRYGGELAMGRALLRAQHLDAEAWQLAVWDGEPVNAAAGTALDVATWTRTGRPAAIVFPDGRVHEQSGSRSSTGAQPPISEEGAGRVVRAMLFGDVRGFSRLTDEQLPAFATHVLGAFARVIERYENAIEFRNTWGDAIYLVLSDVAVAAECALDLQKAVVAIDLESAGLPAHLALRLGGHVGPVFRAWDPVLKTTVFIGSHVSRTARIEPVTPPGEVYVTEAFAARLLLASQRRLNSDYVGHMPAAKGYGNLRMYRLRRSDGAETSS